MTGKLPIELVPAVMSDGSMTFTFTNGQGPSFSVFGCTNPSAPFIFWNMFGGVKEISPGKYRFVDPRPAANPQWYFRVRSP